MTIKTILRKLSTANSVQRLINIRFINRDNSITNAISEPGQTLQQVAKLNQIDLRGTCEGNINCCSCHVILEEEVYRTLTPPTDQEEDLLDLAPGMSEFSRLGCQVQVSQKFDGKSVALPSSRNRVFEFSEDFGYF